MGETNEGLVNTYSTLLKHYEAMFWNTLGATP